MRIRIALAVFIYTVAIGAGAFVMSGNAGLAPFGNETAQAQNLSSEGSPILLCSGYGFACNGSSPFYPINQPINPCAYGCLQAYAPFDMYPFVRQPVPDFVNNTYTYPATYYSPSFVLCPGGCAPQTRPQNATGQNIQDPAYSYIPATIFQPPFGFTNSSNGYLYGPDTTLNFGVISLNQIYGDNAQFGNTWSSGGN
jgi:hypothetical protein